MNVKEQKSEAAIRRTYLAYIEKIWVALHISSSKVEPARLLDPKNRKAIPSESTFTRGHRWDPWRSSHKGLCTGSNANNIGACNDNFQKNSNVFSLFWAGHSQTKHLHKIYLKHIYIQLHCKETMNLSRKWNLLSTSFPMDPWPTK